MPSDVQPSQTGPSALSRAEVGRALGIQMRLAPTREERAAAARALLARRKCRPAVCEWCGAPFEAYGRKRFCSPAHADVAYHRRTHERQRERDQARRVARRRVPDERPCVRCGKPFMTTSATRRYCGQDCRQLAYLERQRPLGQRSG